MGEEASLPDTQETGIQWAEGWQVWEHGKQCPPFSHSQLPALLLATACPTPKQCHMTLLLPTVQGLSFAESSPSCPPFSAGDAQLWGQLP